MSTIPVGTVVMVGGDAGKLAMVSAVSGHFYRCIPVDGMAEPGGAQVIHRIYLAPAALKERVH